MPRLPIRRLARRLAQRLTWFVGLWCAGVAVVGAVALLLRAWIAP